jgi:hypothetical protein
VGASDDRYEFPFVSEEAAESEVVQLGPDLGEETRTREPLYKPDGDGCRPVGDQVGWVYLREEKATTDGDIVALSATIRTNDGHKVEVNVLVSKDPDGKYGSGKGGMSGGTGKWKGRTDVVDFDECNPKRWRIGEGP